MSYRIEFVRSAAKEFRKLPKDIQKRVLKTLQMLEIDPYSEVLKIRKLRTRSDLFRVRIGDYRMVYSVENERTIVIFRVRHRKDVYDHLI